MRRRIGLTAVWLALVPLAGAQSEPIHPPLIKVDWSVVAFSQEQYEKLAQEQGAAGLPGPFLLDLWHKGEGRLLASASALTRNGVNTTTTDVREVSYASAYSPVATNLPDRIPEHPLVYPSAFETREVGTILNVTPTLDPDGARIELTLSLERCLEPEWVPVETTLDTGGKDSHSLVVAQPVFAVQSLVTSILVEAGKTTVVGGATGPDGETYLAHFVTATLVNPRAP